MLSENDPQLEKLILRRNVLFLNTLNLWYFKVSGQSNINTPVLNTSGFWPRMRARALRAPVFLGSFTHQTGRCAPPPPIAASLHPLKEKNSPETKCFPSGPRTRAARGVYLSAGPPRLRNIIFPAPRPTYSTLLSYAAPYWALLHPKGLCCTKLSYGAPFMLRCTLLSYTAPDRATLHLTELRCAFLS
jgi:hypothetical protein